LIICFNITFDSFKVFLMYALSTLLVRCSYAVCTLFICYYYAVGRGIVRRFQRFKELKGEGIGSWPVIKSQGQTKICCNLLEQAFPETLTRSSCRKAVGKYGMQTYHILSIYLAGCHLIFVAHLLH